MPVWSSAQYDPLPSKEVEAQSVDGSDISSLQSQENRNRRSTHLLVGSLSTAVVILGVLVVVLVEKLQVARREASAPSFSSGWRTEFRESLSPIYECF